MAPFNCACLSLIGFLLLATGITGDESSTTAASYQIHQHHRSFHHYRNLGSAPWSSRHIGHAAHRPHSRHNHESALQRRVTHLRSLGRVATTTMTTTTTTTTEPPTTMTASRYGVGPYAKSLNGRPSSPSAAEPIANRSVAYDAVLRHRDARPGERQVLQPIYPNPVAATTPPSVYSKFQPGRRVCSRTSEADTSLPHHHTSHQARLVYTDLTSSGFLCCPGWAQVTRLSFGCNKPVCSLPCQNGGVCSSPGRCTCLRGFAGNNCQIDVDECVTEKPCDQICINGPGNYECYCRNGYELQSDRHSCRKNDSDGTALEARDLEEDYEETTTSMKRPMLHDTENEVSDSDDDSNYEDLLRRLIKLEKQLAKGKKQELETNEIGFKITSAVDSINEIRRNIQNIQTMQQEIYELRNKVKLYEYETRKIQQLTNRVIDLENQLRMRCRSTLFSNSRSSIY